MLTLKITRSELAAAAVALGVRNPYKATKDFMRAKAPFKIIHHALSILSIL
jgi:hypothetical protein